MTACDVVVVGAGMAGLSAAYELRAWPGPVVVLEAAPRAGGVVLTERIDGFTVDAGPDSLLVQKPAALDLCRQLGLDSRLVSILPPRTAYVLRDGRLEPLPPLSVLGIPLQLRSLATSRLFSMPGRLRMALDLVRPAGGTAGGSDESVASFIRRRFGDEAVRYLAEPLLAGIHAGDVERLSMKALFPRLLEAEARHGGVIRAFRRQLARPEAGDGEGLFRSLAGGMSELVEALAGALPPAMLRCNARVVEISGRGPYLMRLACGERLTTRAIVLAIPADAAADLLDRLDADLAARCRTIRFTSTATIVLAYDRRAVRHPLTGTGFLAPRVESACHLMACTWVSSKWPGRAPPGHVLLRAFMGGARNPELLDRSDAELIDLAHRDLARLLGISRAPSLTRIYRWIRATPQHEVGHLDRMAAIEQQLERLPGIQVTGGSFRGVGIPDCIADGRATAEKVMRRLRS
jgi:protoporphyrinogen/coproporphyrinogen III oxidase